VWFLRYVNGQTDRHTEIESHAYCNTSHLGLDEVKKSIARSVLSDVRYDAIYTVSTKTFFVDTVYIALGRIPPEWPMFKNLQN